MSEEKPIFPRSSETSNEEENELRQKAKLNLEAEERQFQANSDTAQQKIVCATNLCAKLWKQAVN